LVSFIDITINLNAKKYNIYFNKDIDHEYCTKKNIYVIAIFDFLTILRDHKQGIRGSRFGAADVSGNFK
jgi:hypothetical protein